MEFNYEKNRIYVNDEDGKLIVEATFPFYKDGVVVVDHTYVDPSLRGQGIASDLMKALCKYVEQKDWKMVATCPYAVVWLKRHKDFDYLVDQESQSELKPECQI